MEPISSSVSARATASQAPVPVQQRQNEEALSAPKPRTDTYSSTVPVQELQLQRRQVVEDLGKNESVQVQLQDAGKQLQQAKTLSTQAQGGNVSSAQRQQLQNAFSQVGSNLSSIADKVDKAGTTGVDTSGLRVSSTLASPEEAQEAGNDVDKALEQVESGLANVQQQQNTLGSTFPRSLQTDTSQAPIQNRQEANQIAVQLQQKLQQQPDNALATQANVSKQTALTLFQ